MRIKNLHWKNQSKKEEKEWVRKNWSHSLKKLGVLNKLLIKLLEIFQIWDCELMSLYYWDFGKIKIVIIGPAVINNSWTFDVTIFSTSSNSPKCFFKGSFCLTDVLFAAFAWYYKNTPIWKDVNWMFANLILLKGI